MATPRTRIHAALALSLATCVVVTLTATSPDIGLTWDEPVYMEAGEAYASWMGELITAPSDALRQPDIVAHWNVNHEHPPLDKLWSGLMWNLTRATLDDITAHRFGNIIIAGALAAFLYLLVAPDYGVLAGVAAVAALYSMPRVFFHAHLASLDVPAATAIVGVCALFWHVRKRATWRWDLALGGAYALAAATKITALLELPIILAPWALALGRRARTGARLVVMAVAGVTVFVLIWPWLYHDTLTALHDYLSFMTVDHYRIGQWYLNRAYEPPPWHYVPVLTAAVVPLTIVFLGAFGVLAAARAKFALCALLVIGVVVPMLLLETGKADIYDGERLWMPSFPFIAALAGVGFSRLASDAKNWTARISRARWSTPVIAAMGAAALLPQAASAHDLYPHLLSYYSESIGGLRGATRLGLETTYWSETYADALDYLNSHAAPGAMIWAESHDVLLYYQRCGRLRSDLRIASHHGAEGIVPGTQGLTAPVADADLLVLQERQSGLMPDVLAFIRDRSPRYQLSVDGIVLMQIYER